MVIKIYRQIESEEPANEKAICAICNNDTFRAYIPIVMDGARLYCTKCGMELGDGEYQKSRESWYEKYPEDRKEIFAKKDK